MRFVARLIATVALIALPAMANAQTVVEAMSKAYNNNPDLAAARAELRSVDELAPQAISGFRPSVTANASTGVATERSKVGGNDDYNPTAASLRINQPLYRGGQTLAEIRQADSTIAAQRAILKNTEQNTLLSAVQAYLDVLRDKAVVDLTRNNEAVLARQLQATRDRFAVGEVTKTDVSQAESRLSGAKSARIQAEGNLTSSKAAYRRIIGEEAGQVSKPTVKADLPGTVDEAIALAETNNPGIISAVNQRAAADAALDRVKGERLPTISLDASATRTIDNGSSTINRVDSTQATVGMTWPLYTGGSTSSRIREAKQVAVQRSDLVESSRRRVIEQATTAWESLDTARAVKVSRQAQVSAATVALDGVRQESVVGSRTVLDTLNAEQELLDAKVGLVRAERDEILAMYELLAAVGRMTARDMQLPVDYYDEKAYAKKVRHKPIGSSTK